MPPWHGFGLLSAGASWSGRSAISSPQAPLWVTALPAIVTYVLPANTMPVPTGAPPESPEPLPGTFGLLLSWRLLLVQTVQDFVPSGPVCPSGQRPICGDGQSSLFCELLTRPVLLLSHSLLSTCR